MRRPLQAALFLALLGVLSARLDAATAEAAIVLDPPVILDVLSKPGAPSDIRYLGQPAKDGKIDLTPTNGFFDGCFMAGDSQPGVPGDQGLIGPSFGFLGTRHPEGKGTARWHLWCAEAGEIKAQFFMKVSESEAKYDWTITVENDTQKLKVQASDGESGQKHVLTFNVKQPGKVTFTKIGRAHV